MYGVVAQPSRLALAPAGIAAMSQSLSAAQDQSGSVHVLSFPMGLGYVYAATD